MGEDSLLERVTAAAEERQLSHNSFLAYRRTSGALARSLKPKACVSMGAE